MTYNPLVGIRQVRHVLFYRAEAKTAGKGPDTPEDAPTNAFMGSGHPDRCAAGASIRVPKGSDSPRVVMRQH